LFSKITGLPCSSTDASGMAVRSIAQAPMQTEISGGKSSRSIVHATD
jgi:hypothetical protein